MIAILHQNGAWGRYWIRLLPEEKAAVRRAHWLSFILCWKTPAEIMGADLEAILSGHIPSRLVFLEELRK